MQNPALEHCKSRIERRLGWGDADGWTTQDFEDLSLRIQEQTGRAISATTLKRLWGRVAYHSSPSRHSLDTLALFIGHPSWRDFTEALGRKASPPALSPTDSAADAATSASSPTTSRLPRGLGYAAVAALLLSLSFAVWTGLNGAPGNAAPADVSFQSRPVASGVPNTVIFSYDVHGVKADSFFIQQSWDQRRRAAVAPGRRTHTSTYYHPGFFNAKLLADDRVLAEHPVHVTTDGWIALIEGEPSPIYLTDAFSSSEGSLSVAPTWLRARIRCYDDAPDPRLLQRACVRCAGGQLLTGDGAA